MKLLESFSLLFRLLFILVNIKYSYCLHSSLCIRLPKESLSDASYALTGSRHIASVGIEKFPQKIWGKYFWNREAAESKTSAFKKTTNFFVSYDARVRIELFAVHGRAFGGVDRLNGWFRVRITVNWAGGINEFLKSFLLFVTDEQFNFIGQFVHHFPSGCENNDATANMIISCSGISQHEPFAANMIVFARNNTKLDGDIFPKKYQEQWPIVPNLGSRRELNFYYHLSMQDSNRNMNRHIIFRIIADPDDKIKVEGSTLGVKKLATSLLTQATWFKIKNDAVPGIADPLPTHPWDVSCLEKIVNPLPLGSNEHENWQWYMEDFSEGAEYDAGQGQTDTATGLVPKFANAVYSYTGCIGQYFGGRCNSTLCSNLKQPISTRRRPIPRKDMIPQIHSDRQSCTCGTGGPPLSRCFDVKHNTPKQFNSKTVTFPGCLELYKSIQQKCSMTETEANQTLIQAIRRNKVSSSRQLHEQENASKILPTATPIPIPPDIHERQRPNASVIDKRGVRTFGFGTILYSIRKGHGVAMIIVSIFCIPVSLFVSRYFKETFLQTRILHSRMWFQIHVQLGFWKFALYFAGMVAAIIGKNLLGVSLTKAGLYHRIFGWISVTLFVIAFFTGGLRFFEEPGREYSIIAHWLIGYAIYFLNFLAIITSIYIPGSPSADLDTSVAYDENIDGPIINTIYIPLVIWLLHEVVMQALMTFLLRTSDRKMRLNDERMFIPSSIGVPIPVLKENADRDAPGSGMRSIILWIYIGVASLMAAGAVGSILRNKPKVNIGFGPMACTHHWSQLKTSWEMQHSISC